MPDFLVGIKRLLHLPFIFKILLLSALIRAHTLLVFYHLVYEEVSIRKGPLLPCLGLFRQFFANSSYCFFAVFFYFLLRSGNFPTVKVVLKLRFHHLDPAICALPTINRWMRLRPEEARDDVVVLGGREKGGLGEREGFVLFLPSLIVQRRPLRLQLQRAHNRIAGKRARFQLGMRSTPDRSSSRHGKSLSTLVFFLLLRQRDLPVEGVEVEGRHLSPLLPFFHQVSALLVHCLMIALNNLTLIVIKIIELTLPYILSLLAENCSVAIDFPQLLLHAFLLLAVLRDFHLVPLG